MTKKIISILICCFAIITIFSAYHVSASSNAEITVESVDVKQGATNASVKIDLKNNPGLVFAKFQVVFGSEFTLSNVVDGGILGNATHSNNKISPYILYWNNGTATQDFVGNGTIATLNFTFPSDIPTGTYPITISVNQGSTFNFADEDVKINTVNGKINVVRNAPATYTINYNSNGGSSAPASQTKTHDVALTLSTEKPIRNGYTFIGWGETATGNSQYAPGESFTKNSNTTLYAIWIKDTIFVTGVSLNKTSATLTEGDTLTLNATVAPSNATNKSVTWSTSNPSVATVSNGVVTAKGAGTTTITVKTADGSKTAICAVTVKAKTVSVTGVSLNKTSATLTEGDTLTLNATVAPTNATNKSVTWSTSNPSVATVSNGVVTAKAAGTATITVKTADGSKTATCAVTVKAKTVTVKTYTISYDANGGIGAPSDQIKEHDVNIKLAMGKPTRSGYTFMGWAVAPDTAVMADAGSTFKGNKDLKLYAVWKNNSYLGNPELMVSSEKSVKGSLVDVTISLKNIDSPAAVNYSLYFDSTVMKPVAFSIGGSCTCCMSNVSDPMYDPSTNRVTVFAMGLYHGIKEMTLTFEILDDASKGTYQLIPTIIDALDCGRNKVQYNTLNGKITVTDSLVGDVTGDSYIDTRDAVLLAQYLASWSVKVDKAVADCNADGYIDTRDAVLLAQYLANWKVTLG